MTRTYMVVYRIGLHFTAFESAHLARGLMPHEAWVFGRPITRTEEELYHAVEPVLQVMKPENVHRVSVGGLK